MQSVQCNNDRHNITVDINYKNSPREVLQNLIIKLDSNVYIFRTKEMTRFSFLLSPRLCVKETHTSYE